MIVKCPTCQSEIATRNPEQVYGDIKAVLTAVCKEARAAAFRDAGYAIRRCSLRSEKYPNRYISAAAFKNRVESAVEAAANTEEGAGNAK